MDALCGDMVALRTKHLILRHQVHDKAVELSVCAANFVVLTTLSIIRAVTAATTAAAATAATRLVSWIAVRTLILECQVVDDWYEIPLVRTCAQVR